MTFECQITDQPGQPTLAIRTRSSVEDLPLVLGSAFGAIVEHMAALGETPAGAPYAAYFNMDMQDLDVEVGFPVDKPLAGTDIIQPGFLPTGKAATCLYTGPYADMGEAYEALKELIEESGYIPRGSAYEFYYDSPDTPPEKTRTLIMLPLKTIDE